MMFLHMRFGRIEDGKGCFEFGSTSAVPRSDCLAQCTSLYSSTVSHVSTQKQICRYLLVTYFVAYTSCA